MFGTGCRCAPDKVDARDSQDNAVCVPKPTRPARRPGPAARPAVDREAQCLKSDASACAAAGRRHARGDGVARDPGKALALFRRGCDGGDAESCAELGAMYEDAHEDALAHGLLPAELRRRPCARLRPARRAVRQRPRRAARRRQGGRDVPLACNGGEPSGCLELGRAYEAGRGVPRDDGRAVAIYRRGCDGGSQAMCVALAALYDAGHGIAQDTARAAELYRAACPSEPRACTALARATATGRGVVRDDKQAHTLYGQACDRGDHAGCIELAETLLDGPDAARGRDLLQRACTAGDALGCFRLAQVHADGRGVTRDDARAAELDRQACNGDLAAACTALARLVESGHGVPRDAKEASALYGARLRRRRSRGLRRASRVVRGCRQRRRRSPRPRALRARLQRRARRRVQRPRPHD